MSTCWPRCGEDGWVGELAKRTTMLAESHCRRGGAAGRAAALAAALAFEIGACGCSSLCSSCSSMLPEWSSSKRLKVASMSAGLATSSFSIARWNSWRSIFPSPSKSHFSIRSVTRAWFSRSVCDTRRTARCAAVSEKTGDPCGCSQPLWLLTSLRWLLTFAASASCTRCATVYPGLGTPPFSLASAIATLASDLRCAARAAACARSPTSCVESVAYKAACSARARSTPRRPPQGLRSVPRALLARAPPARSYLWFRKAIEEAVIRAQLQQLLLLRVRLLQRVAARRHRENPKRAVCFSIT